MLKTYFTLILYTVAFCQLFTKDVMDGWTTTKQQVGLTTAINSCCKKLQLGLL